MTAPTPSSTCSAATGDSPSPSRLWPTPNVSGGGEARNRTSGRQPGSKHHDGITLADAIRLLPPSASRRSSPMPVPCSPIGSLACPTSDPFSQSPEIAYFASAVSSRLSSLAAFLASPTATPASDSPATTSATSGLSVSECFGSFDPALPSLRTSPDSSQVLPLPRIVSPHQDFFSTVFCQTWPRSGLLVRGKLYQRPTLVDSLAKDHPIAVSGSGSSAGTSEYPPYPEAYKVLMVPTRRGDKLRPETSEEYWTRMATIPRVMDPNQPAWPTPIVSDALGHSQSKVDRIAGGEANVVTQLREVVQMECSGPPPTASGLPDPGKRSTSGSPAGQWLTPRANEPGTDPNFVNRMGDRGAHCFVALNAQVESKSAGKLNPSWVETLMGLPLGWTQLPRKFVKPKAVK